MSPPTLNVNVHALSILNINVGNHVDIHITLHCVCGGCGSRNRKSARRCSVQRKEKEVLQTIPAPKMAHISHVIDNMYNAQTHI